MDVEFVGHSLSISPVNKNFIESFDFDAMTLRWKSTKKENL